MTTAKKVQPEATLRSINMAYPSSVELASSLPERHRFHQQTGLFPLLSFAWEPSNQKKQKNTNMGMKKMEEQWSIHLPTATLEEVQIKY